MCGLNRVHKVTAFLFSQRLPMGIGMAVFLLDLAGQAPGPPSLMVLQQPIELLEIRFDKRNPGTQRGVGQGKTGSMSCLMQCA